MSKALVEILEPLDTQGYPNYTVSNLGYVINRRTQKVLFPSVPTGQVRLVDASGKGEFVRLRPLLASKFMGLVGVNVWPADNDLRNNSIYNLLPISKKSHIEKAYRELIRLVEDGVENPEVLSLKAKLPQTFVELVMYHRSQGFNRGFQIHDGQPLGYRWLADRLALIAEHGEDMRIEFRLHPYAMEDHWRNIESIDEVLNVREP